MKHLRKILALLLLVAGAAKAQEIDDTLSGTVEWVSERPPVGSGFIAFYVEVRVKTWDNLVPKSLLIAYMGEDQILPKVGATCEFALYPANVASQTGQATQNLNSARIVKNFACFLI